MKKVISILNVSGIFFRKHKKLFGLLILCLFFIHDIIFAYNNLQNKTPIIGLRLQNHFLIGKTHKELVKFIHQEAEKNNRPLVFSYDNKLIKILPSQLGYSVDAEYLANALLLEGRTGNLLQKFKFQEKALLGFINENIKGKISQSLLALKIIELQTQINQNPKPISLDFVNDMDRIIPAQDGHKIQVDKLSLLISKYIHNPPTRPIPIPTYAVFANQHSLDELNPIKKQAKVLLSFPISISSGGLTFTLTPDDLKQMATIIERPNPRSSKKAVLSLRLDETKLNQRLGDFAAQVENITHAEFNDHDARVAIYSQFYNPQGSHSITIPTVKRVVNPRVLGVSDHSGPKTAYLTFDDGPNMLYHPMILDILRSYDARATFFLVGKNVPLALDVAMATAKNGHLVGNHSFTHSFLPNLQNSSIIDELKRTDNILQSLTMQPITFFRPPYGGINQSIVASAHQLGLKIFLWDIDPRDWSEPSTEELVRRVVNATRDGSNILLHSNHLVTVKALPKIIETLKSEGYTFKTLDQYPQQEQL